MALIKSYAGASYALNGKMILRDSSGVPNISNLAAGSYGSSQFGNVILVDRPISVVHASGAAGFSVIHPDGTYEGNVKTQTTADNGDIILWSTTCDITITIP